MRSAPASGLSAAPAYVRCGGSSTRSLAPCRCLTPRDCRFDSAGKRLKVVLYNPWAVFFTMPLALLAIGSELDPDVYEVVIIDARLDSDAENTVLSHIGERGVPRGDGAHRRADLRCAAHIARGEAGASGSDRGMGRLASVDVLARMFARAFGRRDGARAGRGDICRDRGASCAGPLAGRLRGLHGAARPTARFRRIRRGPLAQVDKFRAHDYGLIPVERYYRAQGQAPARLHLLARLQFPLRVLLRSVRLRTQVGGARARPHGDAAQGAVGPLPFR